MADPFQFELASPERLLVSEPVDQVVAPAADGYFTMLKGHAPYMAILNPGIVEVTKGSDTQQIYVRGGFSDVNINGLTILAEEAVPVDELDPAKLAQDIKNAEEDANDASDPQKKAAAQTRLQQLRDVQNAIASG